MRNKTRMGIWLDRLLIILLIFALSGLWLWDRTADFAISILLSVTFTILAVYTWYLLHKKVHARNLCRDRASSLQKQACYALTMLPYSAAMRYICKALSAKHSLLLCPEQPQMLITESGMRIRVYLHQSPQKAQVSAVHAFHRRRKNDPGVFLCAEIEPEAQAYANSLQPPMRVLRFCELHYPEELANAYPLPDAPKQKRTAAFLLHGDKTHAVRCMLFSFGLLLLYLLTEGLLFLFPALLLSYYAVLIKRTGKPETLF